MRRGGGGGHYGGAGDSSADNAYSQIQHHPQQHARSEEHHQQQQQWRWERESPKLPTNAMSPHMFNEGQGAEVSRSYYHGQRTDPRMPLENQGGKDLRSQQVEEDMDIGYEDNSMPQSLEGLEQKFLDDIMKLSKEQNDAEDAENARHRERINNINAQYQDQLVALRTRHASRRDDILRRESQARRQQYQLVAMDNYPNTNNPPPGERRGAYNTDNYDSYRDRSRFLGSGRDHGYEPRTQGYEPRTQYPGSRAYDSGSRYY